MCEVVATFNEDGEPPAKKTAPTIQLGAGFKWNLQALSAAADAVQGGGKSPVSALNELGVRVLYTVRRQSGPAHCPSFTVTVTVADMTFEGCGHSKREARAAAARACLGTLLARAGRVILPPRHQEDIDFAQDDVARLPTSEFQCLEAKMKQEFPKPLPALPKPQPPPSKPQSPAASLFGSAPAPAAAKSPINQLYETYPGLQFHCTFGDGTPLESTNPPLQLSYSMRFKVVCVIKDQQFEGYGSSKKLAKLAAARSALARLQEGCAPAPPPPSAAQPHPLPQGLADHVAKLVNEKFNDLMKDDIVHSKRKVLAGIVLTYNNRPEGAKVIAVTTGTKCVSGEHMSERGRAVNDCHAEVCARRALQRHLYRQLYQYARSSDPTKLIPTSDIEPLPGGGYTLRKHVQVHLYVSTAPCGDGRIFSPHETSEPALDRHPNRLARGQLRTKIESGEGTIPVKNSSNTVQTWDGVMQGERLLTMSCSDKAARWCCVGLQGALLALLLRPVYPRALVLGSLLHPAHTSRALYGRIEGSLTALPPPYALHRVMLARAASAEVRSPARAPSFSVAWCENDTVPEIINATTGKLESGQPSLLCKQSMFARWQYLVKRLPLLPQSTECTTVTPTLPQLDGLLYQEAKQLSPGYQLAKQRLIEAFDKAKLGKWVKKPLEQDQFICELTDADPELLFAWADSGSGDYSSVQANSPMATQLMHMECLGNDVDSVDVDDFERRSGRNDGNVTKKMESRVVGDLDGVREVVSVTVGESSDTNYYEKVETAVLNPVTRLRKPKCVSDVIEDMANDFDRVTSITERRLTKTVLSDTLLRFDKKETTNNNVFNKTVDSYSKPMVLLRRPNNETDTAPRLASKSHRFATNQNEWHENEGNLNIISVRATEKEYSHLNLKPLRQPMHENNIMNHGSVLLIGKSDVGKLPAKSIETNKINDITNDIRRLPKTSVETNKFFSNNILSVRKCQITKENLTKEIVNEETEIKSENVNSAKSVRISELLANRQVRNSNGNYKAEVSPTSRMLLKRLELHKMTARSS